MVEDGVVRARIVALERGKKKVPAFLFLVAMLAVAGLLLAARPVHAQTVFTVNSIADPGTGGCDAAECTLREAIDAANTTPNTAGPDQIFFDIPGSGAHTITPASFLPSVTDPVIIDGYTQQDARAASSGRAAVIKIELNGEVGSREGCMLRTFQTSGSVVKGLAVNRSLAGICLILGTGNRIEGNFIGTDVTGTQDLGNDYDGVGINDSSGNTVGGSTPDKRNVISGNGQNGVTIFSGSENNRIEGNYVGTRKDGTGNLGNDNNGVHIGASENTVGGTLPGAANVIAFSKQNGVGISDTNTGSGFVASVENRVLSNRIFSNQGPGIDLGIDGRTPNDTTPPDTGPNLLQNYPEITSAQPTKKGKKKLTSISGSLTSTPGKTFTIQIFSSSPEDADEGKTLLGEATVSTDSSGNASFDLSVPRSKAPVGSAITATATDPDGNTSEFSDPRTVG